MPPVPDYEKLGAFYLGKVHDLGRDHTTDGLLLYDAKDLTTHAVCVGMTGSGKTGLGVTLLEEAAIDGVPAIVIDPKGDMSNLALTFPRLRPEDFRPWIDESEAQRKGMTVDEFARDRAELWKNGLADWEQDGKRIKRFRDAAEVAIYTPGSSAGRPLTVLRSFAAPGAALLDDSEAMRDRVSAAVSGLLALLGIDADPIRSREHILVSNILDRAWRAGRDLDLGALIGEIQSPPFDKIGVLDLESFFSANDRFGLAMSINALLASPGFAGWMEGEPLDVGRLLYTEDGKPRVSILSIAHLGEAERMFFVTILLNEVVSWMRSQAGTASLRALLYMDEVFGYFPPTANPPSKVPMLTLLKQARAYGLGVVLATQNPVDLDYKGLSNAGTWFIGRLQTERDKMRVLEGLEGASVTAGASFDRGAMEATLAGLGSRVFLMNNVHEDTPVVFHTRWALSYLRGPLTRTQIRELTRSTRSGAPAFAAAPTARAVPTAVAYAAAPGDDGLAARPPALPPGVKAKYIGLTGRLPSGATLVYRPALAGVARMHFARVSAKVDHWQEIALLTALDHQDGIPSDPWEDAEPMANTDPAFERKPDARGRFAPLPGDASQAARYKTWQRSFVNHLYRTNALTIWRCRELRQYSQPGDEERDFRIRLRDLAREKRDLAVEKLRKRYGPKLATLQDRIRRAEQKVDREKAQFRQSGLSTAVSLGATVLGALFGRKAASVGTVGRAGSTVRSAGRTAREKGDIARATESLEALHQRFADLELEFEEEIARAEEKIDVDALELEEITVRAKKTDTAVRTLGLVWLPYSVREGGIAEAMYE